jgi:hypothetical protein
MTLFSDRTLDADQDHDDLPIDITNPNPINLKTTFAGTKCCPS